MNLQTFLWNCENKCLAWLCIEFSLDGIREKSKVENRGAKTLNKLKYHWCPQNEWRGTECEKRTFESLSKVGDCL